MKQITKQIIIVIVAVVILLGGWWLYNFLITEQVTITTSDTKAKITLSSALNTPVGSGEGSLSTRLKPGTYAVEATSGDQKTRTMIRLTKGTPANIKLDLVPLKATEQISPDIADYPVASNDFVRFIWGTRGQLMQLDLAGNGLLKQVDNQRGEYNQALWVSPNQAYLGDTADNYYFLDGNNSQLLPYTVWPNTLTANGAGQVAYIAASGSKAIVRPSAFAEPSYEVTTQASQAQLALGAQDHLLIYDLAIQAETIDTSQSPAVYKNGAKLEEVSQLLKNFTIDGAKWSPDGNKLAFSTATGLHVLDVPSRTVTQLYSSPPTDPQSMTWQDNQTLLYFHDQDLWRVSIADAPIWTKLAHTDASVVGVLPIALSPNQKLYFSSQKNQSEGALYVVKLAD